MSGTAFSSGFLRLLGLLSMILLSMILPSVMSTPAAAQAKPVIQGPVDNSQRTVIPGSTHKLAQAINDVAPVSGALTLNRMVLVLGTSEQQATELRQFLDSQHDKNSANYHRWLTPEEFGRKFGPAAQDMEQVKGWLQSKGFAVGAVAKSGLWVEFSGTAQQAEGAFHTTMRQFLVAGRMHIANASDISVPTALAPVVRGVLSLHDFFKQPMLTHHYEVQRNAQGELAPSGPDFTGSSSRGPVHFLSPGDYATIYNLGPLYQGGANGIAQSIAIVARSEINIFDLRTFRNIFGLPARDPVVFVNGPDVPFDLHNGDAVEASLDVQWSGAVAPGATIDLVVSSSTATSDGVDLSAAYIVDNNLAPVMSVSFGECEQFLGPAANAFYNALWQQAAAQGISVFVSSGDSGAAGCDDPGNSLSPAVFGPAVSGLASTPFNTAVGGTQFNESISTSAFWTASNSGTFSSAIGYIPEAVWNESCDPRPAGSPCATTGFSLFAGSGGVSSLYAKPSWQTGSNVPNDAKRDLPDVSLTAAGGHDGYLLCFGGSCVAVGGTLQSASVVGGTSASSPAFAGIMAIINQRAGGRQGLANYLLYTLSAAQNDFFCNSSNETNPNAQTQCIFNDITAGDNNVPGQAGASASGGFDLASGLGSVNAANLLNSWVAQAGNAKATNTTLAASINGSPVASISGTHGQAVSVTINVAPAAAGGTPTGNVSLITNAAAGPVGVFAVAAGPLTGGSFSGTVADLPGGTYNVRAHYPGDGVFAASDSIVIPVTITAETGAISVTAFTLSSAFSIIPTTSIPYGGFLDLHADAGGASRQGAATGTVSFQDTTAAVAIGSSPLNQQGQAELLFFGTALPTTALTVGAHAITASFPGDSSFTSATSAPFNLTVSKGNPAVTLSPVNPFASGQPNFLNAFVNRTGPILPTGTVEFFDGGVSLGPPVAMQSTQAVIQVALIADGIHNITANYSGDAIYNAVVSQALPVTVVAPFSFVATTTSATVAAGQTATYNLTLETSSLPSNFNGTVSVTCSGAPAGTTCTVNPASGTVSSSSVVPVTVTVATTTSARLHSFPFRAAPFVLAAVFAGLMFGARKRRQAVLLTVLAMLAIGSLGACGGGGSGSTSQTTMITRPPTTAILTVTGTSGSQTSSVKLNLTITH